MDHKDSRNLRLSFLAVFLLLVLGMYLGVLYKTQVTDHEDYLAQSIRTIAREEKVEASRGVITDRNGQVLVSNRSTYNLTFDSSLLKAGQNENEAILRLVELCRDSGVAWTDNLPITRQVPFAYTLDGISSLYKQRFLTYLQDLKAARTVLGGYLLAHPEVLADQAGPEEAPLEGQETDAGALVDRLTAENLTAQLLEDAGLSAATLLDMMRKALDVPAAFSLNEARLVLGVQYELSIRQLMNITAYVLAEDVDTALISLLSDGGYAGARITSASAREYETTSAAHILGYVSPIYKEDMEALKGKGYSGDDKIGREGVEAAFEEYLRGADGLRIVSTNSDGKITGEYYYKEPRPGNTVELTIDLNLQQAVETALADTVTRMNEKDGKTKRGASAVVTMVGTGEILALASYPSYDPAAYNRDFNELSNLELNPGNPLMNRATQGAYAPGSTFKPLTAVAALQEGVVTPYQKIRDTGRWVYPGDPNSYANCWKLSGHGLLNVTQAITNSCNYFFAEMGYRLGLDTLNEYALAFGLGESTGIEIGDRAGTLAQNNVGENQAPWAAFGQANYLFTPLQLSNYIATLVSGGKHCQAHLLKAVKSYDNTEVVALGNTEPRNTVSISETNLLAVKQGMYDLTTVGSLSPYFKNCVVDAGAKTGTAQINSTVANTGVFVCFAPYDDPEIAVSVLIEEGGTGAALAAAAVEILNAYFSAGETAGVILGENQLLQ